MEHFGETRTQHWARNRAQGAEPTRRRGCGGQLDQVTGVGSPAHGLVELEVGLGLGDPIGQLEGLGFFLPGGRRMSLWSQEQTSGWWGLGVYSIRS
jgi:hypothetical protein